MAASCCTADGMEYVLSSLGCCRYEGGKVRKLWDVQTKLFNFYPILSLHLFCARTPLHNHVQSGGHAAHEGV